MNQRCPLPSSLVEDYRAGATLEHLARKYRCSLSRVYTTLVGCGEKRRSRGPAASPLPDSIAQEYESGATVAELAAKYRTHFNRVVIHLNALGVAMRQPGSRKINHARNEAITRLRLEGKSFRGIGAVIGLSGQRVHQIHSSIFALRKTAGSGLTSERKRNRPVGNRPVGVASK